MFIVSSHLCHAFKDSCWLLKEAQWCVELNELSFIHDHHKVIEGHGM